MSKKHFESLVFLDEKLKFKDVEFIYYIDVNKEDFIKTDIKPKTISNLLHLGSSTFKDGEILERYELFVGYDTNNSLCHFLGNIKIIKKSF